METPRRPSMAALVLVDDHTKLINNVTSVKFKPD
jgi:hypothetical protein